MVSLREVGKQELGRKDTHSMEIQKRCSEISSVVTIPSKVEKKTRLLQGWHVKYAQI